jgi:DNA-binding response OmpR family regulator
LTCALIVEDSPTQAEQLKFILQTAGFDVVHAEDGRAALEKIVASDFDVVISDSQRAHGHHSRARMRGRQLRHQAL